MYVRMKLLGTGEVKDEYRVDLPTYLLVAEDHALQRGIADVPLSDIPDDVLGYITRYPIYNIYEPSEMAFPQALKRSWREHLARRYDLGNARWNPEMV